MENKMISKIKQTISTALADDDKNVGIKIGKVSISNDAVLAPLAGFSDAGFRGVCKHYGAGLTFTEMVSAKGLVYDNEKTKELLITAPNEDIKAVQIFGSIPSIVAKAASNQALSGFDIIDINMGCPVHKIVASGEGSAMLKDITNAMAVVRAAKDATDKAVTVKFRKGYGLSDNVAVEFALAMQEAGADALTLHARTRQQFYSGAADWQTIAEVKKEVKIPLFANGDIFTVADYKRCKNLTGCDGFMIARGALGHPSIFAEITNSEVSRNKKQDILEQIDFISKYMAERVVVNSMKKHICYYAKGMVEARSVKAEVCKCDKLNELLLLVNKYF